MAPKQTIILEESGNASCHFETKDEQKKNNAKSFETMPLWRSCRLFIALIGAAVTCTSIASQASMTSAMVCMIKEKDGDRNPHYGNDTQIASARKKNAVLNPSNSTSDDSKDESWLLSWDSQTQGWVISSFFFGYYFMQIPSGIIVTKLGPKGCITFGLIPTGVLHLLTIPTARWSLPVLYAVRTVAGLTCGFTFTGVYALIANWCPRQETSVMFAIPWFGLELGNSFVYLVSLVGCELDFQGGWPVVFYTLGFFQILVGLIVLIGVRNFPTTHPCISQREADYITKNRVHDEKSTSIPYGKISRSLPVWAFLVGMFAFECAYYTIITQGSIFLRDILRLSPWKINTIVAVPFITVTPLAFLVGKVCDNLVAKNIASTTYVRKANEAIAKILLAGALSILACLPVDQFVGAFCVYLVAGIAIQFSYVGFLISPGDLSPAHAGFLAGLGQGLTMWVSFVIPVLTGQLTSRKTREGWYIILFTAVGLQVLCLAFFLIFGSGERQEWATPAMDETLPINDKRFNKNKGDGEDNKEKQSRYRTLSVASWTKNN